jgi:hypothetical protein
MHANRPPGRAGGRNPQRAARWLLSSLPSFLTLPACLPARPPARPPRLPACLPACLQVYAVSMFVDAAAATAAAAASCSQPCSEAEAQEVLQAGAFPKALQVRLPLRSCRLAWAVSGRPVLQQLRKSLRAHSCTTCRYGWCGK